MPISGAGEWAKFAGITTVLEIAARLSLFFSNKILSVAFSVVGFVCGILEIAAILSFMVAWTRVAVLGPGSVARRKAFTWGRPERNLLTLFLVLSVGCLPIAAPPLIILVLSKSLPAAILAGVICLWPFGFFDVWLIVDNA